MAQNILLLRGFCNAGTQDYVVGVGTYWSDQNLQDVLDRHMSITRRETLQLIAPQIGPGNAVSWHEYQSQGRFFESNGGTPESFWISDGTGGTVGTAAYTPDFPNGYFYFSADTRGSSYFLNGQTYDMNAAAADVWTQKASHFAEAYDFSTDNHRLNRSQVIEHCLTMAKYYAQGMAVQSVTIDRPDTGDDAGQLDADYRMTRHSDQGIHN
jgi:cysteine synthase